MPRPRVFISSTFYDLRYIRESLYRFVEGLGYEPVLSERGNISYTPYVALDESCFQAVRTCDMLVLIVGGRYGSSVSGSSDSPEEQSKSITEGELLAAQESSIPVFVGIEAPVWAEFKTFLQNRDNPSFQYAHADSAEVYQFIERIVDQRTAGPPIFDFHGTEQFETWLREQWTGLFQRLLDDWKLREQTDSVTNQLDKLEELNKTLQTYLEALVQRDSDTSSDQIVEDEKKRLAEEEKRIALRTNSLFRWLHRSYRLALDDFMKLLRESTDRNDFAQRLAGHLSEPTLHETIARAKPYDQAIVDLNRARQALGLTSYDPS